MAAGSAAAAWRRFTVSISSTNLVVVDSANMNAAPTGTSTALAAATSQTLNLFTLEGGGIILAALCKPTTAFTGGAVTATTIEVGVSGNTDGLMRQFNIFTAVAATAARQCFQLGPTMKLISCALPDTTAATKAVPVAATATGAAVGDTVLGCAAIYGPAAGFTEAGSTGASAAILAQNKLEGVVSVADQVQITGAASPADLTPYTGSFLLQKTAGLFLQPAAGTAIVATFSSVGANMSALTAGQLELFLLVVDAPLASLGIG